MLPDYLLTIICSEANRVASTRFLVTCNILTTIFFCFRRLPRSCMRLCDSASEQIRWCVGKASDNCWGSGGPLLPQAGVPHADKGHGFLQGRIHSNEAHPQLLQLEDRRAPVLRLRGHFKQGPLQVLPHAGPRLQLPRSLFHPQELQRQRHRRAVQGAPYLHRQIREK